MKIKSRLTRKYFGREKTFHGQLYLRKMRKEIWTEWKGFLRNSLIFSVKYSDNFSVSQCGICVPHCEIYIPHCGFCIPQCETENSS